MRRPAATTGICAFAALTAGAIAAPVTTEDLHATPRLLAERPVAMPGETIWLAIDFTIDEGWHTYWPGINDSGFALDTVIETSSNASIGEAVWPAPHRYVGVAEILDHVFEEHMTVLLPLTIDENAKLGDEVSVEINGRWLVCQTACVMEQADLSLLIPVSDALSKPSREVAAVFERARERVPAPITDETPVRVAFRDSTLRVSGENAVKLAFYPRDDCRSPRDLLTHGVSETGELAIEFRDGDEPVKGVLEVWTSEEDSRVYLLEFPDMRPVPSADTPEGAAGSHR